MYSIGANPALAHLVMVKWSTRPQNQGTQMPSHTTASSQKAHTHKTEQLVETNPNVKDLYQIKYNCKNDY